MLKLESGFRPAWSSPTSLASVRAIRAQLFSHGFHNRTRRGAFSPVTHQPGPPEYRQIHVTYAINYDANLNIRTPYPPPSEVKRLGRKLTAKELKALKDKGLPGYRATLSDLAGAMYVSAYLEKSYPKFGGGTEWRALPRMYCMVHHYRPTQKVLVLYRQYVVMAGTVLPPLPYLIGDWPESAVGLRCPRYRLKTVVVHASYPVPVRR